LLSESPAKILVSYGDCPEIRALYGSKRWRIVEKDWKYSGTYARTDEDKAAGIKEERATGHELLIMNY